jgi:hypothetical protein
MVIVLGSVKPELLLAPLACRSWQYCLDYFGVCQGGCARKAREISHWHMSSRDRLVMTEARYGSDHPTMYFVWHGSQYLLVDVFRNSVPETHGLAHGVLDIWFGWNFGRTCPYYQLQVGTTRSSTVC